LESDCAYGNGGSLFAWIAPILNGFIEQTEGN
jgi:hypothetical protein